jgi:Ca2+-binding RTX toxin-like protein
MERLAVADRAGSRIGADAATLASGPRVGVSRRIRGRGVCAAARTTVVAAAACCAAALVAPGTAAAAVSCSYDTATDDVTVTLTQGGDVADIEVRADGLIHVERQAGLDDSCRAADNTPAAPSNTNEILVTDSSSGGSTRTEIDMTGGRFEPGLPWEGTEGSGLIIVPAPGSEVEFAVNAGTGTNDWLTVRVPGDADPDPNVTIGAAGVNLNPGEPFPSATDADVTTSGIDRFRIIGTDARNELNAQGGDGTGGPTTIPTQFEAGAGDDVLHGGDGPDPFLRGHAGNDEIYGGGDQDEIEGGPDDDKLDGQGGADLLKYETASAAVTVSLATTAPQDTGGDGTDSVQGFEKLLGSVYDDRLTGGAAADTINGFQGNDTIDPGPGSAADTIDGGGFVGIDVDTLTYEQASAAVSVDLSAGPTQSTGGAGDDNVTGIQNLVGSPFDDRLTGDGVRNVLDGGAGGDVLAGGGGDDQLVGGTGGDTVNGEGGLDDLRIRDGASDTAVCGSETDSVEADMLGVDAIAADCESVAFAAGPSQGGPGGDGSADGATVADTIAPTIVASLSRRRFRVGPKATPVVARRAGRGTTFRYVVSEAGTLRIAISRRTRGRRVRGRCRRETRRNRGARRCTRFVRAGTLTRTVHAGAAETRFSGRIGRRALRLGRYRATLTAIDAVGNFSAPRSLSFRVVRR